MKTIKNRILQIALFVSLTCLLGGCDDRKNIERVQRQKRIDSMRVVNGVKVGIITGLENEYRQLKGMKRMTKEEMYKFADSACIANKLY